MPWDAETFKARHWRAATPAQARKAAAIATSMVEDGEPEGVAIATAIKLAKRKGKNGKGKR